MRMMLCKVQAMIDVPNGPSVELIPGVEYDMDRVLTPGDPAHDIKDFTVADAVQGKESDWFEAPPVEESPE